LVLHLDIGIRSVIGGWSLMIWLKEYQWAATHFKSNNIYLNI
jgi:hypothetical protein